MYLDSRWTPEIHLDSGGVESIQELESPSMESIEFIESCGLELPGKQPSIALHG
jgi:hypothetical protein